MCKAGALSQKSQDRLYIVNVQNAKKSLCYSVSQNNKVATQVQSLFKKAVL